MKARTLLYVTVGAVVVLLALNLVWTFTWIGEGLPAVLAIYAGLVYMLVSGRRVPIRWAFGVVGLALLVESAELLNAGPANLGRLDYWMYGANVALAGLFVLLLRRFNRAGMLDARV